MIPNSLTRSERHAFIPQGSPTESSILASNQSSTFLQAVRIHPSAESLSICRALLYSLESAQLQSLGGKLPHKIPDGVYRKFCHKLSLKSSTKGVRLLTCSLAYRYLGEALQKPVARIALHDPKELDIQKPAPHLQKLKEVKLDEVGDYVQALKLACDLEESEIPSITYQLQLLLQMYHFDSSPDTHLIEYKSLTFILCPILPPHQPAKSRILNHFLNEMARLSSLEYSSHLDRLCAHLEGKAPFPTSNCIILHRLAAYATLASLRSEEPVEAAKDAWHSFHKEAQTLFQSIEDQTRCTNIMRWYHYSGDLIYGCYTDFLDFRVYTEEIAPLINSMRDHDPLISHGAIIDTITTQSLLPEELATLFYKVHWYASKQGPVDLHKRGVAYAAVDVYQKHREKIKDWILSDALKLLPGFECPTSLIEEVAAELGISDAL